MSTHRAAAITAAATTISRARSEKEAAPALMRIWPPTMSPIEAAISPVSRCRPMATDSSNTQTIKDGLTISTKLACM